MEMKGVMRVLFRKNFNHSERWHTVVLGEEGLCALHDQLRRDNLEVLKQCLDDAVEIGHAEGKTEMAIALFSKLADAKFTRISATLDEMVEEERKSLDGG